ncbi:TPA: hypothetical protein ACQ29P_000860 [Klebsiella pneumoniae]
MQQFSKVEVLSLSAKICDRCGRQAELATSEFQEFLSLDRVAGYGSVFGDGECLRLDLCQHCTKKLLGVWIQSGKIA